MINIIAHRGLWNEDVNFQNTRLAFQDALKHGFGIETDIRDSNGELVISHDVADKNAIRLVDFLDLYNEYLPQQILAINIKSDGLHDILINIMKNKNVNNYFVFDMSIPDTMGYIKRKIPTYLRMSEYEDYGEFYKEVDGIWLDSFNSNWFSSNIIDYFISLKKKICIISPEIHNRNHESIWQLLKSHNFHLSENISICTDLPDDARIYFYE